MGQAAPPKLRVVRREGAEPPVDPPPPDHPEFSEIGRSPRFQPLWWLPVGAVLLLLVVIVIIVT
jgi:hypothetical protein